MITKEMLLKGSSLIKTVHLETVDDDINIRPLTQAEVTEYNRITAEAMGVMETGRQTKVKVNVAKTTVATGDAQAYAVATSLVDEDWTVDEVKCLDGAIFKELFNEVAKLSGLDTNVEEEVENFLKN